MIDLFVERQQATHDYKILLPMTLLQEFSLKMPKEYNYIENIAVKTTTIFNSVKQINFSSF